MSNIVEMELYRRLRRLNQAVKDIKEGRMVLRIQGRVQGKSMSVDQVLAEMENYFNHSPVPVGSGAREMAEEAGVGDWYSLRGRGEDMRKQLPTAQIIPFRSKDVTP